MALVARDLGGAHLGEKNPGSVSPRSHATQAARCLGFSDVLGLVFFFFFNLI